jgi:integrase
MAAKQLPPGIDLLPSGKYRARWRDQHGKQQSATYDRLTDAKSHRNRALTAVADRTFVGPAPGRQTFAAFADEWLDGHDVKETSRARIRQAVARLVRVLDDDVRLAAIDPLTMKAARLRLNADYAPNTASATFGYFGTIMRAAHAAHRIPTDPTVGTETRSRRARVAEHERGKVTPEQVPTRADVVALWRWAPARFRAPIALGTAGLRIGEVFGVGYEQLDLDARTLTVERQVQVIGGVAQLTTPKGERSREIVLPAAVVTELRRHARAYPHGVDGVCFPNTNGGLYVAKGGRGGFYEMWQRLLVAAGLDASGFVFHGLRHFCASSMLAGDPARGIAPTNPVAVAGYIGDTVQTLQRVYAHWLRDDRDVPAAALDALLRPDDEQGEANGIQRLRG